MAATKSRTPSLIECGNHEFAPWSILCVHLSQNGSSQWNSIPIGDSSLEVENDWLCDGCMELYNSLTPETEGELISVLRPVCMHCVHRLQEENPRKG